ncbi:LuxR C-terminal-related transcriptional regulator [Kitasatospora sp. NPDC057223]|uniref:LuxR C-terminal-related transcriptional regulator n=1 Tax=Kitasatospora sp. NPDC057223 TaxID=3346055 RepID=UPI003626F114
MSEARRIRPPRVPGRPRGTAPDAARGVAELVGRDEERARLAEILDLARRGMSATLVLRGGPGVGKTTLLDDLALRAAGDFEVIRFDAVESEAELGYAALHQVLASRLGGLAKLPGPQRGALGRVFGFEDRVAPPDRLLVSLGALGLLTDRPAGSRQLLCLVDDAQWLDRDSADVLGFVARRLYADSTAMAFALRDDAAGAERLTGLPDLAVEGLDGRAAYGLLARAAGGDADPGVAGRLVDATGGNPLALIEAVRELDPEQLSGRTPLPDPVPVGLQLERGYLREVAAFTADTRTLLLAAAADSTGSADLLWRAGTLLGFGPHAAAPAEGRGLIAVRETVRFRHPLIRSAVYYGAPRAERARVHAALAAAVCDAGPAELRAWHLAAAATGPDEVVAAELELAAGRVRARGSWSAAATLLGRAGALTPDGAAAARRLLAAAEASAVGGNPGRAQSQLDEAAAHRGDPRHTGLVLRAQARIHRLAGAPAAATGSLLAAARELGAVDVRLARDILVEALVQAQVSDRMAPAGADRRGVAEAAAALPLPVSVPVTTGDLVLDADTAVHLEGIAAALPRLRGSVTAVLAARSTSPEVFQWLAAACSHATVLGDDIALYELAWRLESLAREQGAVLPMALALSHTALSELIAGRLPDAERLFDQRAALAEAGGDVEHLGALLVAGWRGDASSVRELSAAVDARAARTGQGYLLVFRSYAQAVLALADEQYAQALLLLEDRLGETSQLKFALVDAVEAAVRSGRADRAKGPLAQLTALAEGSPVPSLLGDLARARALVATDALEAEELYRKAVAHHGATRGGGRLARSRQVYGEWLRRERRVKEARVELRAAHDLLDAMGARAFAARCARELAAAGENIRSRDERPGGLTAQQARVAHLAATGATNAEIAAQLFLSAHTVDYHLRNVFRKLDVRSRRDLARLTENGAGQGR